MGVSPTGRAPPGAKRRRHAPLERAEAPLFSTPLVRPLSIRVAAQARAYLRTVGCHSAAAAERRDCAVQSRLGSPRSDALEDPPSARRTPLNRTGARSPLPQPDVEPRSAPQGIHA